MMTTMAALLGGMPMALGWGAGRRAAQAPRNRHRGRPFVSQMLTLFTTPVIYLYFDKLGRRFQPAAGEFPGRPGFLIPGGPVESGD